MQLPHLIITIPLTLTLTLILLALLILPSSARPNTPSHTTLSLSLSFPPSSSTFPLTFHHPRDWRSPEHRHIFKEAIILNNGWSLHYNTLDIIAPNIPIAATSLLHFYDLILASLEAGDWEPRHRVFASTPEGGIKLGLYAAETLITKEWLGAFVKALKRRVVATHNAGSTMASFKMTAVSAVSGVAVAVSLVLPLAGAAVTE